MASTDKKKVKITETSKQASVDITSETIQLPADSVDHTLVAKVPSGANCTSGVNVEVEMSPDGENWCPALRKELVTTPGSTTAQIIGNEKYVDLQKNDPVFNSYAKGGLNFDVNGNEVSLGTGARDLLDQHIAVNKSFNHSMWLKSDTLPTSTYKPVLFRHGGHDPFENLKAVDLTHNTFTNEYALTSIGSTTRYVVTGSTPTYGIVGTNSTYNMPLQTVTFDRDWSMTCRLFVPANTNGGVNDVVYFLIQKTNLNAGNPQTNRFHFGLVPYGTNAWRGNLGAGFTLNGAGFGLPFHSIDQSGGNWSSTRDGGNDNWYLVSLVYTAGTGITARVIRESDGAVEVTLTRNNVVADIDWSNQANMFSNNGPFPVSSTYNSTWDTKVDQYVFYDKALSLTELQELIANNQINDPLATSFASNIISYRRFGDGPNDVFSSSVVDVMGNAQDVNTTGVFDQLSSTDSGYSSSPVVTQNLAEPQTTFTTTANRINAVNGEGNVFVDANSDAQTFYSASGNVTTGAEADIGKHLLGMFSPTQASSTSRWLYARSNGDQATWRNRGVGYGGYPFMNYPSAGNYVRYNGYLNLSAFISYSANDAALKYLSISPAGVGGSGYWYVYDGTAVNFTRRSDNTSLPVYFNDGYHCAVVYTPPADITQGIPEANVAVYINGVRIKIRTTTESGVEYVEGAAPADNFYSGDETYAANSAWGGAAYLDYGTSYRYYSNINNHMDFQRALSESEVKTLYNKGQFLDFSNMQTSFPISLSNCVGAYDADVMFLGTNNTYVGFKDCSGFGKNVLTAPFNNSTSMTQALLSPALEINAVPVNVFKADFSVDNSLSISGWFKTSNTATGTLFSNTGGAAATGLKVDVTNSGITASYLSSSLSTSVTGNFNDGEWHHIVMVLSPGSQLIVVDNISSGTSNHTLVTDDLRGDNGFTLLGDGQENANNPSPSTTDTSKLSASLSNWSLHSEALSTEAIAQLYSNGHVRNIKNLPSVDPLAIEAWWQLADTTNPQNDISGNNNHLQYVAQTGTVQNTKTLLGQTTTNSSEVDFTLNTPYNLISGDINNNTMPNKTDDWTISIWARAYYVDVNPVMLFRMGNASGQIGLYYYNSAFYGYVKTQNSYATVNVNNTISTEQNIILRSRDIGGTRTLELISQGNTSSIQSIAFPAGGGWGETSEIVSFVEFSSRYVSIASGNASRGGTRLQVSEASFFNTALSDADVATLGAAGPNGGAGKAHTISGIQTYFRMGDGANDEVSPAIKIYDDINYSANHYIQDTTSNTVGTVPSLATTDRAYTAPSTVIGVATLSNDIVPATGATLVEKSINGNAMTLSFTKNFNFTTESWVSDASGEAALCLSLNGFEEQAEYFALWKCSQTLPDGVVDVCDGNWHNIALSYRGQNNLSGDNVAEGDAVRFGRGSSDNPFNFSLAIDGYPLYTEINNNTGADYIGGLNTLITDTISSVTYNVGFNIYNRHLKYDPSNTEEQYRVHGQFGSGVHTYLTNETDPNSFRGEVDETSFHTDPWWSNADGTNIDVFGADTSKRGNLFNQEKTYTLYGRTTALAHRGSGATYPIGVPYPLLNPELLVTSGNISDIEGTNQFLNPVRKGDTQSWDSQTSTGGLEGWWRWGDTPGDCSITVNDVKDHNSSPAVDYRDIQAVYLTDQGSSSNVVLATNESIYLEGQEATTTAGSAGTQYNQIKLENLSSLIGTATCAVKDFVSPVLQYLRIKLTGTGTCDIGEGKLEIEVNHKKRRMK